MAKVVGIGHMSFTVMDIDKSLHFYVDLLGGKLLTRTIDEGPELGKYVMGKMLTNPYGKLKVAMVDLAGLQIEFLQYLEPETNTAYHRNPSIAGSAHIAVNVDDIEGMVEKLKAEGIELHSEINDCIRDGELVWRWVYSRDPDGCCCEIVQLNYDSEYIKNSVNK
jgi:catechol 2,3-dioxygenase-like lactoylglutathione lyase family enzyme